MPFVIAATAIAVLGLPSHKPIVKPSTNESIKLGKTKTFPTPALIAVAVAPSGDLFAASFDDDSVRIIDARTGKTTFTFKKHPQPAYGLAFSYDGKFVASGDESARVFVWNIYSGQVIAAYRSHTRGIECLSFNRPRTMVMSTGRDDFVKVYSIAAKKVVRTIPGNGASFYGAHFNPYTNAWTTGTMGIGARVYDINGIPQRFLDSNAGLGVLDAEYNATGTQVITAGKDGSAMIFDVHSGKRVLTLKKDDDWIINANFAPNGKVAVTSSDSRTVRLWDTKTGKQLASLENESAVGSPARVTSDGKFLISSNTSDQLQITPISPPLVGGSSAAVKPTRTTRRSRRRHRPR